MRAVEMDFRECSKYSGLTGLPGCLNLSYMRATLTISLPPVLRRDVSRAARVQRVSESEFVRRAVQKQLWADAFEETRRRLAPKARAQRIYTDEDVFKLVS
ncbi:MAG: CopG family transcriptional regulator [Verrucomicrobia bacterium]|nr:CopG family transcriptional regulator [Verrucomicrobiota bacterium]